MLFAAIVCALAGFGLLVMAVQSPSDTYSWLLVAVTIVGLVFFVADVVIKRRRKTRDAPKNGE